MLAKRFLIGGRVIAGVFPVLLSGLYLTILSALR